MFTPNSRVGGTTLEPFDKGSNPTPGNKRNGRFRGDPKRCQEKNLVRWVNSIEGSNCGSRTMWKPLYLAMHYMHSEVTSNYYWTIHDQHQPLMLCSPLRTSNDSPNYSPSAPSHPWHPKAVSLLPLRCTPKLRPIAPCLKGFECQPWTRCPGHPREGMVHAGNEWFMVHGEQMVTDGFSKNGC